MKFRQFVVNCISTSVAVSTIGGFAYIGIKTHPEIAAKAEGVSEIITTVEELTDDFNNEGDGMLADMTMGVNNLITSVEQVGSSSMESLNILEADMVIEPETTTEPVIEPVMNWDLLDCEMPTLDGSYTIDVSEDVLDCILSTCEEYDVPYELALAVCYMESRFQSDVNNAGLNSDGTIDYGMMGLNDKYLPYNCDLYNNGELIDPYDVYDNVNIGIQILDANLDTFDGSVYDAACAYNLGPTGWKNKKASGQGWYYGDDVLAYIDLLEQEVTIR